MNLIWGGVLTVFTLILCWLGQVINATSPTLAARMGLAEPEEDVDPVLFVDGQGEAVWDALILWTLPAAGILLMVGSQWWIPLGLIGGGMYVYFSGCALFVRSAMRRRSIRIGKPESRKLYTIVLVLWGLIGAITIAMATTAIDLI